MGMYKYFNIPVQLLQGFMTDSKEVLNNISDYAIYKKSLEIEYEDLENDIDKIEAAAEYYSVELGSPLTTLYNGRTLYESIPIKSPKIGISLPYFWDYFKNDKTDFQKITFLAYLALKSIIGAKQYCKVVNNYWYARMDGKTIAINDISELSPEVRKYYSEYFARKIKHELSINWHVHHYSHHTRGFYVCLAKKFTFENLVLNAEKKRDKCIKKQQAAIKEAARLKAIERIAKESKIYDHE